MCAKIVNVIHQGGLAPTKSACHTPIGLLVGKSPQTGQDTVCYWNFSAQWILVHWPKGNNNILERKLQQKWLLIECQPCVQLHALHKRYTPPLALWKA